MKLYDIKEQYLQFMELAENGNIPPEAIEDTLDGIAGELREKADNIACVIKQLLYESAALAAEEQALFLRRRTKEKTAERLKKYLSDCLLAANMQTLETARNKIMFRKSQSVEIEDMSALCESHPELVRPSEPLADKTAVKKLMMSGVSVNGCRLKQHLNMQIR